MVDLHGRTAVITGASRGIGEGLARELQRQGMRLALCARGPIPVAADVVERVDVTDEEAVRAFAARAAERLGRVDLWINNAGVIGPVAPLRDSAAADIAAALAINVMGVVHGSRAYVDIARRQGGGVLLQMSSGAGRRGFPGMLAYCASKAAVDRLTECVQAEEADAGLRAHSVAPGMIDTAMHARLRQATPEELPGVAYFRAVKERGAFSSPEWVARQLLAVAFDPARRPDAVIIDLPMEHPLP
jgi:NAD(P)-dependent dehydrogenase (short-subunit alcohol dehydrogenase family)